MTKEDLIERIDALLRETEEYDDWEPTDIAEDALGLLETARGFLTDEDE